MLSSSENWAIIKVLVCTLTSLNVVIQNTENIFKGLKQVIHPCTDHLIWHDMYLVDVYKRQALFIVTQMLRIQGTAFKYRQFLYL